MFTRPRDTKSITGPLRPQGSGAVVYYDPIREVDLQGPFEILYKRKPFEFEGEYRFWISDDGVIDKIERGETVDEKTLPPGFDRLADLNQLIQGIVVAPGASDEFYSLVQDICGAYRQDRLGDLVERSYSDRSYESFARIHRPVL